MLSTSTLDSASGLNAQSPLHIRISSRGESKATAGEVQEENDVEDGDGLDDGMCIFIFFVLFYRWYVSNYFIWLLRFGASFGHQHDCVHCEIFVLLHHC